MKKSFFIICSAVLFLLIGKAYALVNPSLQPQDLFKRYKSVIEFKVKSTDMETGTVTMEVVKVFKGKFEPKIVTLKPENEDIMEAFFSVIDETEPIIAFVGAKRKKNKFILYASGEGRWQGGTVDKADPSKWNWNQDYKEQEFFGTFSGHPARLVEMVADGEWFFPARVFDRFKPDQEIAALSKPVMGVALYDFNQDGKLDIYACSEAGDRLYLQTESLKFTDTTEKAGLKDQKNKCVNVADVNSDGKPDLLLDETIWVQNSDGTFAKTELLKASGDNNFQQSLFVDVNKDGLPDVMTSVKGKGLNLFINSDGKAFNNATVKAGLDKAEQGAGGSGWIIPGDWNQDGLTDVFYTTGKGLLMVQSKDGKFAPFSKKPLRYDLKVDGKLNGMTGAGCFAPIWKNDRPDIVFACDTSLAFLINKQDKILDAMSYGNECQIASANQVGLIAEDLNADGNVDIFLGSRDPNKHNMYYLNRGYGSFMVPNRYEPKVFPGPAQKSGAWGLAAGDVNGDGANDVLLGGSNGKLTLLVNDTLSLRVTKEHPNAQEKALLNTSIVTVSVKGKKGVLGADVSLVSDKGKVVARRTIGSNVATGCRGPDTVNLAVRQPGKYQLKVVFSDGKEQTWPVDVDGKKKHIKVIAEKQ